MTRYLELAIIAAHLGGLFGNALGFVPTLWAIPMVLPGVGLLAHYQFRGRP